MKLTTWEVIKRGKTYSAEDVRETPAVLFGLKFITFVDRHGDTVMSVFDPDIIHHTMMRKYGMEPDDILGAGYIQRARDDQGQPTDQPCCVEHSTSIKPNKFARSEDTALLLEWLQSP